MSCYIFITGGVVSSLGKGLTTAALGAILEQRGQTVRLQKFDPYLNVDPGTMNPYQHGEVYVLDDGAETDLDLGHYERFTSGKLTRLNNLTSGQIYESLIAKERRGEYLGETVQVIPHVTNEIIERLFAVGKDVDILITEIGGTVGDIEGLPFLEAMRQFSLEVGKDKVLFIHVTLVPFLQAAGELKTKPSQQSVAKLREIGILPDILVCRTSQPLPEELRHKLSLFCNVPYKAIIEERDVECSIYEVPMMLEEEKLDDLVIDLLHLDVPDKVEDGWKDIVRRLKHPAKSVNIGVVGKYIELQDAYKSVYESLCHGGIHNDCRVDIHRIDSELLVEKDDYLLLEEMDGILVPGGFGKRGTEGMIIAARIARENNIPYFGLCLGMHIAVIEYALNVIGLENVNSREFDENTTHPVIDIMEDQKQLTDKGATMRLGSYECKLVPDTRTQNAYGGEVVRERHRHRFEFNNKYIDQFEECGMKVTGINPKRKLVEIMEITDHPWYIGVQFHPEFQSKPRHAHPLFADFIATAIVPKEERQPVHDLR